MFGFVSILDFPERDVPERDDLEINVQKEFRSYVYRQFIIVILPILVTLEIVLQFNCTLYNLFVQFSRKLSVYYTPNVIYYIK